MIIKASSNGIDLIHHFEGCHLASYVIPGEDQATIGWGHAIPLIQHPLTITQAKADAFFMEDLAKREKRLAQILKVELTPGQLDATLSFFYNAVPKSFEDSTYLRLLNQKRFAAASLQLPLWVHGGRGGVMAGLVRRRKCEKFLFDGGNFAELRDKHRFYMA